MPVRDEAAFHLAVLGNAAAEVHRVATARGLLGLAAAILRRRRRGSSADQHEDQQKLASHDLPSWRFRRPVGPGAVSPKNAANAPIVHMPAMLVTASVAGASF